MRDIIGTWRLVMTRAKNDAGEPMHSPYGPSPMGVVTFSAEGRMIAVLCDGRPSLPDDEPVRELELAPLDPRRSLMVLNLGGGNVRTLVLELEGPLQREELQEVAKVLRERLATDADLARYSAVRVVARAAMAGWSRPVSTPLFASGAMHMAKLPEFADATRLGSVLRSVESGTPLDRLMVRSVEGQAAVRAGVDEDRALAGCSLVSYSLPGSVRGAVGVLGPLRMDYARTLAVVDAVGSRVADLL